MCRNPGLTVLRRPFQIILKLPINCSRANHHYQDSSPSLGPDSPTTLHTLIPVLVVWCGAAVDWATVCPHHAILGAQFPRSESVVRQLPKRGLQRIRLPHPRQRRESRGWCMGVRGKWETFDSDTRKLILGDKR